PSTLCVNTATSFANVSGSGNLANQWQWTVTPASGVTISAPNAATTNITFTNSGSYTIQLTASNNGSSLRIVDTVVQVLACSLLDCRRDNQQWIFGWGQQGVDFSSGSPRAFVPPAALFNDNNQESYITRTDANGQILYFTNGSFVYDGNFNKLNATSFHPLASSGAIYNSSAQIISLPFPGHPGEYLMFVPNKGWDSPPLTAVAANYPPHTIVDINMNGTPSATPFSCNTLVVPPAGETFSFNQFAYSEQITAIPHANGRDYWIVFPVASVSAKLYLVSFLLSPAGLKQQAIQQIESSALIMSVGYGLAVSPSHNRLAFKYMNFALEIQLATLAFNNRTGSFGAPVKYSLNAYNIPQPGGIVFYDDTHAYLSRTGGTGRGILDLDLLTGVGVDFAAGNEYSRFSIGPDGQIYTIYKAGLFGANSQALARIDRVAGVPTVNIAIPGNQLSGNLTGFQGINFWNLDENVYCRPDTTNIDFSIIRTNCNSYQFVLNDSANWYPYNVIWNFGDGSPSITLPANQPATHSYATPGLYPVSMQVFVTGCLSSNLLPAQPVVHLVEPVDANAPLIIQGPDTICINSQLHDVSYTTAQSAGAQYTWSVVSGDAIVRQPSSGLGIYQAWYSFGQTAGPRTIQVQMTEGSCSVTGTLTVTGTLPGQAHAGQNGSLNICASVQQPIDLFSLITGEDPGGYWIRISGTGGIFNAANATFTPQPGATSSVFQYILSGNTGCTNADTSEASIQILSTNGAGLDGTLSVCQTDYPTIDLFAVITGESAGGVWERVSGTGGVFNSAAGTFAITATATSSLFRYIIIGNNGCPNDSSLATITVNIRVPAGSDGQVNICNLNGPVLTLTDYIPGAFNGGTWVRLSGTGGVFNATAGTFGPVFAIEQSLFEYRTPTNGVCPGDTSRVTVTVGDFNPLPDTDTTQCGNQSLNLQALYDLSGYTIVQPWFYNAAPVANPTAVSQSGLYTTVISNGSNCSDTLNVRLQQSPAAQANAGPDTIAVYGQPLQLQGSGNGNPQWTWSPLNATVSNAQIYQPLVTLTAPEYWFILQVSNANECKAADSVRIKVYRGPTYYVPTVFTPNGDGLNDALVAIPVGIIQTEFFRVYNRFGELIFETRDPRSGWNGRYKG
ncbi:MAG TPA: T9SS type B sorting domain-containing protein, partial [Ferruginibacter sp.]|nr:T9SS type B sorting domain-containing protein [Ferruginibacter sp.]